VVNSSETVGKIIVGLGSTGLSVARYLAAKKEKFMVVDSRNNPPALVDFKAMFPDVECHLGGFPQQLLLQAEELIVSPGVGLDTKEIAAAIDAKVAVCGDIDLFRRAVSSPLIGVTGSNGKSTVVALLAEIFKAAGISYGLGGNLDGKNFKPALDLLQEPRKQYYILELSSFQLETTARLGAEIAVILNLSADHMDRYESLKSYLSAKQKVFVGAKQIVVNNDEPASAAPEDTAAVLWNYTIGESQNDGSANTFGLLDQAGEQFLAFGSNLLMATRELKMVGQHNLSNVMAAIAVATAAGISMSQILTAVRKFSGLPHRCQWVARLDGIEYYNDSKGTNVGATIAALEGLSQGNAGKVVLIAGGVGKGADFSELAPVVNRCCSHVILIGEDAPLLASALGGVVSPRIANSLEQAVAIAKDLADAGDSILLSPACASFDMFENFQQRGDLFIQAVEAMQ